MGNQTVSPQKALGEAVWLRSEKDLQRFLKGKGVSTDNFGKNSAKSLANLLHELRAQACFLEPQNQEDDTSGKPKVLRIVEPVFIRLCWRCHVLVQEAQKLTDGRTRTRKMLLAEKKEPCDGGGLMATVVRALHEELGLDPDKLQKPGALKYRTDAYHFELEQIDSPSYPGLTSMYRTHHVMVDIPDESLALFRECGLPEFRDFVTLETTELGTTTHSWRWYDTARALKEKVVKFPPQALSSNTLMQSEDSGMTTAAPPSWRTLSKQELSKEEEVRSMLARAGVDPDRFGKGKAKTIGSLMTEVQKGESSLEWHDQNNTLRRIAEPVFVQFRWGSRVLVEVEQIFTDGRKRQRNMLLAEKKSPEDKDVCATALRGLCEELNLPPEFPALDAAVHFVQEAYCCVAEHLESGSYPGLSCVYVTHYCALQILDAGVPHFQKLGLLEHEFETKEPDKANKWRWIEIEEAQRNKAKGFPELKDHKSGTESAGAAFETVDPMPLDPAELRVLLEVGGVNVSAWGEYAPASLRSLARELENGAAQLERDAGTGKIRRVLQSNLVQLMVEDDASDARATESARLSEQSRPPAPSGADADPGKPNFRIQEARDLVNFRSDLACFEVVHADTASYPGLPCCHQTRLVQFDQRHAGGKAKAAPVSGAAGSARGAAQPSPAAAADSAAPAALTLPLKAGYDRSGSGMQEHSAYPRLLDDFVAGRRPSGTNPGSPSGEESSPLSVASGGQLPGMWTRRTSSGGAHFRQVSILSRDDGLPMSCGRESYANVDQSPVSPKRRSLYRQLRSLQQHLRFPMVANEGRHEKTPPAEHTVACACDIQLIRNINPLNATFHCRFYVFMEWIDAAAVGQPVGEVALDKRKELSIPEIALQNTLATSLEVHSPPEVVNPETGHVACKVLYQALMQMELDMRLFPFDLQRLVLVLGLRARRDRSRTLSCQRCAVDPQIRLDEWRLTSSFLHADRPDGRSRVQFGVVISRAYWYYLMNVIFTLVAIATMSFAGFLLHIEPPFDRLRFGVAVLFAQTTFRLSIENKLPKVSYSTIFDQYAIFCQVLVLTIMTGNALASILRLEVARELDLLFFIVLFVVWILGNAGFVMAVRRSRRRRHLALEQLSDASSSADMVDSTSEAQREAELLRANLHYRGLRTHSNPGDVQSPVRAVSLSTCVWLLHDIDPVSATFECKFTVYLEWLHEGAVGLPENEKLTAQQLKVLDPPELDVHNKVELTVEEEPCACVVNSQCGQIMLVYCYHARLQIHLNLRRFPFDSQRLPINLRMPDEKDQDRAFVHRCSHLKHTAQRLDEWFVEDLVSNTDYTANLAQASLEICIRRRSGYYVISVLSVLMGISLLMLLTIFAIEVQADGVGLSDQGKILVPLFMTLLAFKLLIASGKIPKAAYATIFDRFMIACEALFFLTCIISCITMLLALFVTTKSANDFRMNSCMVLIMLWILHALLLWVEVRCGRESVPNTSALQVRTPRPTPSFEDQRLRLSQQRPAATCDSSPIRQCQFAPVLVQIKIKQVHSVNATTGSFVCEFEASMAWLNPAAKGLPAGEPLSHERLQELRLPTLRVPNALTCSKTVLGGAVVDPATGHVAARVHLRAQVQLSFQLEDFPFDTQALAVVLALPDPRDAQRSLIIQGFENRDAVKISEWSVLGTFANSSRRDDVAQVVFGVTIRRDSRYYVTSLKSLCLWSIFVFAIYTLDFEEFADRGKILVCVLLVSIVAKLAVSSKLPRIARLTSYDWVALNTLALVFGVGFSAALWSSVGRLGSQVVERTTVQRLDQATGIVLFLTWAALNLRIIRRMRRAIAGAGRPPSGSVPHDSCQPPSPGSCAAGPQDLLAVPKDLEALRNAPQPFGSSGEQAGSSLATRASTRRGSDVQVQEFRAISLGVKLWMVCNMDASSATFECKLHVFLDWLAPAAMGLREGRRISSLGPSSERDLSLADVQRPKLAIANAIAVMVEDYSDVEIKNTMTGHVSCRIQYHVKVHHRFSLRRFPFDCQRLEVALQLQNCEDRFLVSDFCHADDQTNHLDGWRLAALSMSQEPDSQRQLSILMLTERESQYYVRHVIAWFFVLTTLLFSFSFFLKPFEFAKRTVDVLKIVLTQTTFRFSVEHRLPKVQHWTPFDIYVVSCQVLCCCVLVTFVYAAIAVDSTQLCRQERHVFYSLAGIWLLWNAVAALLARRVKHRELQALTHQARHACGSTSNVLRRLSGASMGPDDEEIGTFANARNSLLSFLPLGLHAESRIQRDSVASNPLAIVGSPKPWEEDIVNSTNMVEMAPQVVSVAFRIWLVRNVDLVTATFECKFRVFLEWLDEDAIGLPKGKKAKLPVPQVTVTNSVQSQILDRSSAPEVVDSDTGHLAVQVLYRATLRMDQEVHQFPFDCQWLAITLSLRDEGAERSRSFMFQYCEVDAQLQLDEWRIHPKPAFSTLTKHDAPSIQDTVMCGILIRRCARYYAVNILGMLFLISSMVFAIYTIDVTDFWGRAEVFLGIFPLTVLFKMSAQGKLPRVGYSTKFDRYALSCQLLFLAIVMSAFLGKLAEVVVNLLEGTDYCGAPDFDQVKTATARQVEEKIGMVREVEKNVSISLLVIWVAWNIYFTVQAWRVLLLPPLSALKSPMQIRLQEDGQREEGNPDVNGLAPRLSVLATKERSLEYPEESGGMESPSTIAPEDAKDPKEGEVVPATVVV